MRVIWTGLIATISLGAGCANDPEYIPAPTNLEGGMMDMMGNLITPKASLMLPVKLETPKDATTRAALATTLGVMVPYVKVGDLAVSIEYTIQNLDTMPGTAKIELNGANEFFAYDPSMLDYSGGDDEAPPTPGISGDIPIDIAAGATVDGQFTEDEILEASIDLDQITRGNLNPYAAILKIDKNDTSFQPIMMVMPTVDDPDPAPVAVGSPIPRAAFAQMIRFDLVFKPDRHMVLQYAVRVRDLRGIMDDKLLAAPMTELTQFMPPDYSNMPPKM
jgi:hypothetical protein